MRSKILVIALAAIIATTAAGLTALTQQQAQPPVEITEVKDGLYVITGPGGNVGVRVTGDGVVVVDDKFERNYDDIIAGIQGVTDQPVRYVVNTHHHGDHTGGNVRFAMIAQVIAHDNVRANILKNEQAGPPSIVYTDQAALYLGDAEVQIMHLGRGHTNGDSVVYYPDLRVVQTGDLLVTEGGPFVDYANGGDATEYLETLEAITEIAADIFISGHGGVVGLDGVRDFIRKFETVQQRAREAIRNGATKENFTEQVHVDDLDWAWEGRLLRSAEGMFDELSE